MASHRKVSGRPHGLALARHQRGVAVVTALLLTALAVTLVTGIFWQQQILVRGMEGQRLQSQARLIARAALDAACLTLREAAARGNVTTLDGAWTAPLLNQRLDRYLGQAPGEDGMDGSAQAGLDGTLSQHIVDAQSRFNLRNLANGGQMNLFQVTAFSRLLTVLKLDPGLAYRAAEAVLRAQTPAGAGRSTPAVPRKGETMGLQQLDDLLLVPGFSAPTLERLRDFVVVLPEPTAVNVNTASPEVLTSVANFSLQDARTLVEQRRQAYFKDASDFAFRLNQKETLEGVNFQVSSDYFLVLSRLTLERANLRMQALIQRADKQVATASLVWLREE